MPRRRFLRTAAAGVGAAGLATALPFGRDALAQKVQLTGVIWGGPWHDGVKLITAKQSKVDVRWELHQGGSAAIIPKIKASWPNPPYDLVGQFNPLYYIWDREGWAEPFTVEDIPNLKDLPPDIFHRNAKGQIINVPISNGGAFWGYRKDICPVEIKTMEDLLNPKLKGKVMVRDATQGLNSNGLSYAVAHGGDEKNMEPGWEFLKKLAKSGNIGRIGKTEVEFINSLNSGECAAGFWNLTAWAAVVKNFPCEFLIRDRKEVPGFQIFMFNEGFMVPSTSPRKKEAKEFINFFIGAENNEEYNRSLGFAPTNMKSKPSDMAKHISFATKEERDKYQYNIDYDHLSTKREEMVRKFETEIVPNVK
ncbi:MAG: extracellular solute-binding protein [Rhodospirillales bacterium]|nr:extracellular solute-binding protein [Rhodospirillales bacterium]